MHPAVNDLIEWSLWDRILYDPVESNSGYVEVHASKRPTIEGNPNTCIIYSLLTGVDDYTFGDRYVVEDENKRQHYWRITIGLQAFAKTDRDTNRIMQAVDEILNPLDMRTVQVQDENGNDVVPKVKLFKHQGQEHAEELFGVRWDREWGDKLSIELLQRGRAIPEGFGTVSPGHHDFFAGTTENSFSQGAEYRLILLGEG